MLGMYSVPWTKFCVKRPTRRDGWASFIWRKPGFRTGPLILVRVAIGPVFNPHPLSPSSHHCSITRLHRRSLSPSEPQEMGNPISNIPATTHLSLPASRLPMTTSPYQLSGQTPPNVFQIAKDIEDIPAVRWKKDSRQPPTDAKQRIDCSRSRNVEVLDT
jgi:hypothetical protein